MRYKERELLLHITALVKIDPTATISSQSTYSRPEIKNTFERWQNEPLGYVSYTFLRDPLIINNSRDEPLKLWLFIQTNSLSAIENRIKKELSEYHRLKKTGRGMPPPQLYSQPLIRSIYLSENKDLINPNSEFFSLICC